MKCFVVILMTFFAMHVRPLDAQDRKDSVAIASSGQTDSLSFPRPIPNFLPPQLFIPAKYLNGFLPWNSAPLLRPVFHVIVPQGFSGSIGAGRFYQEHPEKFFSTLEGNNTIRIPQLFVSEQMMIGNTLKLGRRFYFMSGILYGAQLVCPIPLIFACSDFCAPPLLHILTVRTVVVPDGAVLST